MKIHQKLFFTVIAVLSFSFCSQFAQAQTKAEKIASIIDLYHEYDQFNGSALVSEKGKVIYKNGSGMANMEWDIPNAPNTKHRIGSITKQFTATLILQLVEEGKLDLEVPVSTYLPDYSEVHGDKITLHNLLTHTSGIPNYTSFPNFFRENTRDSYTPSDFLVFFADSTLQFEPGTEFSYSNSGYFLLGAILEEVSEMSYEDLLQKKIFTPLKMTGTGYDHHNTILKNRASGYEKGATGFINAPYLDMSIPYAAGSIYSTVEDLFLWDQALYTEKVLSNESKELMFTSHIPAFGQAYGYGWSVGDFPLGNSDEVTKMTSHGGGINGFNTNITRLVDDQSVIVLFNNTGGAELEDLAQAIAGILYDLPYDLPKKSLAQSVWKKITDESIKAGIAHYQSLKDSDMYDLDEGEMNNLGYQMIQADNLEAAEAMFKINMEAFPKSFNTYDSYAESLMLQEKNEAAIKYYKKSIEVNPANQNGIDMLTKMGVETKDLVEKIVVADNILETYVGKYELMPEFILDVTKDGSQLYAQATGQSKLTIEPKSNHEFYLTAVNAQLQFNTNSKGKVESVTLFQGGQELIGKKME